MKTERVGIQRLLFLCRKYLYILPSLFGTVYFVKSFPASRYVFGITSLLSLAIIFLLISKLHRYNGHIFLRHQDGKQVYSLELDDLAILETQDLVTFRIDRTPQKNH